MTSTQDDTNPITYLEVEAPEAISDASVPTSYSVFLRGIHGTVDLRINNARCNARSVVMASITETTVFEGIPMLGSATCAVQNVTPMSDPPFVLRLRLFVGWDSDLPVGISVFVASLP
jgi:hypothetical protein